MPLNAQFPIPALPWHPGGGASAVRATLQRAALLACLLLTASLHASQPITPIGGGNALTLPAQRHVVRLVPPNGDAVWLLALQQDGQQGHGLGFFRSEDEGQTWRYAHPIQNDQTHRDTADLLPVGTDVALVYSYEGPSLGGSPRHDVYFQWWRYEASTQDWLPSPAVRVFDSTLSTTGYTRAELARDSQGRLWVQAFFLEPDGTHTAVASVSEDEGLTFQPQASLAQLSMRGGGRLLHLGDRLLFVYGHHGVSPAWFRVRMDTALVDAWQPEQQAFPEGIYHGAALSAVSPGEGRMHLVYKDVSERLLYRAFDGKAFSPPTLLDSKSDWALQPAATLVGEELVVFGNAVVTPGTNYALTARVLSNGGFGPPQVLESTPRFRGYPTAPERLPASSSRVPCIYGEAPDAATGGEATITFLSLPEGPLRPGLEIVHTNTSHRMLAVAPSGTAYALKLDDSSSRLYASTDGARTWNFKARHPLGGSFRIMSALADGTLLANTSRDGLHSLSRSADGGTTWSEVLALGNFRMLTPHSIAELDGTVYFLEYQSVTGQDTPIRLYASDDRGLTWQVRQTFTGHRHGHGLTADPARHALWAFFGDTTRQSGTFRSADAGHSWVRLLGGQEGCVVDAVPLGDGSLLFGQDISYLPQRPHIAQLSPDGTYAALVQLTGPAYSTYALKRGGFVAGIAREPGGDIYPPSEVSAHVWGSLDGVDWQDLRSYPRLDPNANVRADVYFELPSGLLVLQFENAQGFGPGGMGYQLVRITRTSAAP
ncbi:sialidase family protein [Stigmatella sp. ncwal1]|uniref:Sialidase family protein n=1 Tax=Stigmatella ashevillensis TaxID=2995309 RepID=A0ABT5DJG9_9BACT|nr:sialidase family protein [Stigmatella ashevillena]MDC0712923.1 sialidase family protein [Stigmatella ashevillena]